MNILQYAKKVKSDFISGREEAARAEDELRKKRIADLEQKRKTLELREQSINREQQEKQKIKELKISQFKRSLGPLANITQNINTQKPKTNRYKGLEFKTRSTEIGNKKRKTIFD